MLGNQTVFEFIDTFNPEWGLGEEVFSPGAVAHANFIRRLRKHDFIAKEWLTKYLVLRLTR